ncbi:MAG: TolB family protein [Anaerolineae bacterium]
MAVVDSPCPVRRVTDGPRHHFFGYYDKCPWDARGRFLLALEVGFMDRPPRPDDVAVAGMLDLEHGNAWRPLAETTAWNWQQGTHLQWLGPEHDRRVIFNRREGDAYVATILDVTTGASRYLARPIYAVSSDGRQAMTLDFSRVHRNRPGYGYAGVPDRWADDPAPAADGIYHVDLGSGASRLVVSLAQVRQHEPEASMAGAIHWFNHLQLNPSGSRFIFLHRWRQPDSSSRLTRLYTAAPDGSDLALLGREGLVSHFDWLDDEHVLAWSRHHGEDHFHVYTDRSDEVSVLGTDVLTEDGHCSYSPDRRWLLTDTYPSRSRSERTIVLYDLDTGTRHDIGSFYSMPEAGGEIRCDLHPRWSRDGKQICFDSTHEGQRQVYVADVAGVTG